MMRLFVSILLIAVFSSSCGDSTRKREERVRNRKNQKAENSYSPKELERKRRQADFTETYSFDVGKESYSIELGFNKDDLAHFEKQPRVYTYRGNTLPDRWEVDYYNMFVNDDKDDVILEDILFQLKELKDGMSEEEYLAFIVGFVQGGIAYDWDSYYDVEDKLNYPMETLYKKKGVCSDKSLILGKLIGKLGYEVVFMTFKKANHMALGIRVPRGYGNLETNYAFIESTNYSPIGVVPKNFVGGVKIEEAPNIIPVEGSGDKIFTKIVDYQAEQEEVKDKFGDYYTSASAEEKALLEEMKELETEIKELKDKIQNFGCRGTIPNDKVKYCNRFHNQVNKKIDLYNEKVKVYNEINNNKEL